MVTNLVHKVNKNNNYLSNLKDKEDIKLSSKKAIAEVVLTIKDSGGCIWNA